MRVLVMSDMEGVSGIVTWDWVNYGAPMYHGGRKLYTQETNAAVRTRQMIEDGTHTGGIHQAP